MEKEYNEFKQKVLKKVMNIFNTKNEIRPSLFLINKNGTHKIIPLPEFLFDKDIGKDACVILIKKILKISGSSMFCFTTEAWQVKEKDTEKMKDQDGNWLRPSQCKNRIEIVLLTFGHKDIRGENLMSFTIKRENKGETNETATLIPEAVMDDTGVSEGRFTNLFNF